MKVKSLSIAITLLLLLGPFAAWADLWDEQLKRTVGRAEAEASWDETGAMYRANVDFNPAAGKDLTVSWSHKIGMGCAGFGIQGNLFNDLTGEAILDYVTAIGQNVLAAAPELLLAYAAPTVYDKLKELKSHSAKLLDMKFKKCEDIQRAALDSKKFEQRRVEAYSKQMDKKLSTHPNDLDASLKEIEEYQKKGEWPKPLNWLGKPVEELKVGLDEVQGWLDEWNTLGEEPPIDPKILKEISKFAGDIKQTDKGVKGVPPETTIKAEFERERKKSIEGIERAMEAYIKEKKTAAITGKLLEDIQGAYIPIRPQLIQSLNMLRGGSSPAEYDHWLGGLGSTIAYDRVINWKVPEMIRGLGYLISAGKDINIPLRTEQRKYLTGELQSFKEAYEGDEDVPAKLMQRLAEKKLQALKEVERAAEVTRRKQPVSLRNW